MRTVAFQSSFVSGEIDPTLYDRLDLDQHERAARRLSNWRLLPQGGITKRGGTDKLAILAESGAVAEWVYSRDEAFAVLFNPGSANIAIFDCQNDSFVATIDGSPYDTGAIVAEVRYRQVLDTLFITHEDIRTRRLIRLGGYGNNPFATVSGSTSVTVSRQWHNLNVGDLVVYTGVSSFNGATFTGTFTVASVPTPHTYTITLGGAATGTGTGGGASVDSWVLAAVVFLNIPKVDFKDELSPSAVTLQRTRITFIGSASEWKRYASDGHYILGGSSPANVNDVFVLTASTVITKYNFFLLSWAGKQTEPIFWVADDLNKPNVTALANQVRQLLWKGVFPAGGMNAPTNFDVLTPTRNLSEGDTGVGIDAQGNAYLLIEFKGEFIGQTTPTLTVTVKGSAPLPELPAVTTDAAAGSRYEDVWSDVRGWPRSVEFYDGRLCLGGSKALPATFFASVVDDYGNFGRGDAHDDEAIQRDVDVNAADAVEHLIAGRSLMVMSRRGEYYQTETPMTPTTATFKQQTSHGTGNVRPVKVGGSVYFCQRNGSAVRRLLYNYQEDAFVADEVTILARHLLKTPVDMAAQAHPQDGDYIYIVNGDDGSMGLLTVDKDQQVAGWTSHESKHARVLSAAVINDAVYLVCLRSSPGAADVYTFERIDETRFTDASTVSLGSATSVAGLDYLLDETSEHDASRRDVVVRVDFADGGKCHFEQTPALPGGVYTFTAHGSDIGRTVSRIEVGVEVEATLIPLPPDINSAVGRMVLRRKRVSRVTMDVSSVDVHPSFGLTVNGKTVKQSTQLADASPIATAYLLDGQVSTPVLGWGRGQNATDVIVKHSGPGRCTIKSIEREIVATGGLGEDRSE